jgi:hypothetical protein
MMHRPSLLTCPSSFDRGLKVMHETNHIDERFSDQARGWHVLDLFNAFKA